MEVKQEILLNAMKLFMRNGIKSVSMNDIARELGMSKKTLYTHFENKEELIREGVIQHLEEEKRWIASIREKHENALDELLEIYRLVGNHIREINSSTTYDLQKYYKPIWNMLEQHQKSYVMEIIKSNLDHGIKEGLYRDDFDPEIVARLYVSKMDVVVDNDIFPFREFKLSEVSQQMWNYHMHAIVSDKGRTLLKQKLGEKTHETV